LPRASDEISFSGQNRFFASTLDHFCPHLRSAEGAVKEEIPANPSERGAFAGWLQKIQPVWEQFRLTTTGCVAFVDSGCDGCTCQDGRSQAGRTVLKL
jgi:hypothetical protein